MDASRPTISGPHERCGFDVERLQISIEQGSGRAAYVCRHEDIDEHGLVPEVSRELPEAKDSAHADIVECVESVEQPRFRSAEAAHPLQASQQLLELLDFGQQFPSDARVEIMG